MSDKELCTQYEFIIALIESGCGDEAACILKNAVKRMEMSKEDDE